MVKPDEPIDVCLAHSGLVTELRIGGAIIGALMVIVMSLLAVVWGEQKESAKAIRAEQKESTKLITDDMKEIRDGQLKIKWILEGREEKNPDRPAWKR